MIRHLSFAWSTAGLACSVLFASEANAGPPFRTDDPVPVAYGHFELYTAAIGTHVKGDTSGGLPSVELTYGLIPNGQLQIGGELAFDSSQEGTQFGYGDTQLSFKYRFIEEQKDGFIPQVAVFPAIFFPTGNDRRGSGAGHVSVFLPVWMQKSFGDWTTYGGGGYWINQDERTGDKNFWFFGWLLQRKVTEKLILGAEIFHQTADTSASSDSTGIDLAADAVGAKASTGFTLGGSYDFDEHNHLLFSAGMGLQNAAQTGLPHIAIPGSKLDPGRVRPAFDALVGF